MQKKIIALAVAGLASSGAFAQTNVTIYGTADATFERASANSAAYGSTRERDSFSRVNSNSSKIGFRGSEDLGGGLKAIFQVENAVSMDTNAGLVGGRDTFVGLQSDKWGTVRLGLQTTPTRALGGDVDMNAGATGPGGNSSIIGKVLGGNALIAGTTVNTVTGAAFNNAAAGYNSGVFDTRLANAISYTTPTWSGFRAAIAYSAGENKSLDSVKNTATQVNTSVWDAGVFYNNGPIMVGLTHGSADQRRNSATFSGCTGIATALVCAADETSITRLAGGYTFGGGHKIIALYERNRADLNTAVGVGDSVNITQNTWGVGGKFMASPALALIGQYYKTQDASISNNSPDGATGIKFYELGLEYSLSKRTMLKASYTRMNNDKDVAADFNVGAVGGGFGSGASVTAWAAGIRHDF